MEMTIQLIFKIAAVGIVVALINQVLKHSGRDDQAYLVSLAGLIIVLTWIIPYVNQLFQDINTLFGFKGAEYESGSDDGICNRGGNLGVVLEI